MNKTEALAIVRELSSDTARFLEPQLAALREAAAVLERVARYETRRAALAPKTGHPWTEDEDRCLLAHFDAGRTLEAIAADHERTKGAIRARLLKYGRLCA